MVSRAATPRQLSAALRASLALGGPAVTAHGHEGTTLEPPHAARAARSQRLLKAGPTPRRQGCDRGLTEPSNGRSGLSTPTELRPSESVVEITR